MSLLCRFNVVCSNDAENKNTLPRSPKYNLIKHKANMERERAARISRMDGLQVVKRRLVLQQWKLFDNTHDRILMNMISMYDTSSYAFEETTYNELTQKIKRIDKEISILRIALETDTFDTIADKANNDTNDGDSQ